MAKKHNWKQAVRAEVAAALQGQYATAVGSQKVANISSRTNIPAGTTTTESIPVDPLVKKDLWKIGWTALSILVLLIAVAATNNQSHWLADLAQKISL